MLSIDSLDDFSYIHLSAFYKVCVLGVVSDFSGIIGATTPTELVNVCVGYLSERGYSKEVDEAINSVSLCKDEVKSFNDAIYYLKSLLSVMELSNDFFSIVYALERKVKVIS